MSASDPCELHEVAILIGVNESEALLRLARTLGDECRTCDVCRSARAYVDRCLRERAGERFAEGDDARSAWARLRTAVESARRTIRGGHGSVAP